MAPDLPRDSVALAAEHPEDAFRGERGRQLAVADLLFQAGCQRPYRGVRVQSAEQLVADHRPGPVDLLLSALGGEAAGRVEQGAVLFDAFPDGVEAGRFAGAAG